MKTNRKSGMRGGQRVGFASALAIAMRPACHRTHPPLTPAQEEQAVVDSIQHSGGVPPVLLSVLEPKARDLWDAAFEIGKEQLRSTDRDPAEVLSIGPISCFHDGCLRELRFKDRSAATVFEENLLVGPTSPLRAWPNKIYRGPFIEEPKGGIRTTWALVIAPLHYRELVALSTTPDALNLQRRPTIKNAMSNLQQGDQ